MYARGRIMGRACALLAIALWGASYGVKIYQERKAEAVAQITTDMQSLCNLLQERGMYVTARAADYTGPAPKSFGLIYGTGAPDYRLIARATAKVYPNEEAARKAANGDAFVYGRFIITADP